MKIRGPKQGRAPSAQKKPGTSNHKAEDMLDEFINAVGAARDDLSAYDSMTDYARQFIERIRLRDAFKDVEAMMEEGAFGSEIAISPELRADIANEFIKTMEQDPNTQVYAQIGPKRLVEIAAKLAAKYDRLQSENPGAPENHALQAGDTSTAARGIYDVEGPEAGLIGVPNEAYNPDLPPTPHIHDLEGPDRQGPAAPITQPRPVQEAAPRPAPPHAPSLKTPDLHDLEGPDRMGPAEPEWVPRWPPAQMMEGVTPVGSTHLRGGTPPARASKTPGDVQTQAASSAPTPTPPAPTAPALAKTAEEQQKVVKISTDAPAMEGPPASKPFDPFGFFQAAKEPQTTLLGKPLGKAGRNMLMVKTHLADWDKGFAEDKMPLLFRPSVPGPEEPGKERYPVMARQDSVARVLKKFNPLQVRV